MFFLSKNNKHICLKVEHPHSQWFWLALISPNQPSLAIHHHETWCLISLAVHELQAAVHTLEVMMHTHRYICIYIYTYIYDTCSKCVRYRYRYIYIYFFSFVLYDITWIVHVDTQIHSIFINPCLHTYIIIIFRYTNAWI